SARSKNSNEGRYQQLRSYTLDYGIRRRFEAAMLKKLAAAAVVLIVVVIVVVLLIARHMLGSENVRATLERELAARLGQPVTLADASASVFPRVTLHLRE